MTASVADLTPPEREVLTHVCQGKNDPEIGTELGVNRRSALIVWAPERGIGLKVSQPSSRSREKQVQEDRIG